MFLEFLFFSSCTVDKFYGQPASRRARIAELLDRIDDGEEPDNINYIEPPDNATEILTDEESGDEESGNMNNLPGSMHRAAVVDSNGFLSHTLKMRIKDYLRKEPRSYLSKDVGKSMILTAECRNGCMQM